MSTDSILLPNFYYVGNFDDEIRRYSPGELTLETINDTLFQAAIAGGQLLINDGYLMHFEDGRLALTNPSSSPLTDLLHAGFVKLFSRTGGDLAAMPKRMEHIPTYQLLLKHKDWPNLKNKLLGLRATLPAGAIVDWPRKDVGQGFRRLIGAAFKNLGKIGLPPYIDEYKVEHLFQEFDRTLEVSKDPAAGKPPAARTTWNKLIDEYFPFSQEAKEYLHWIGIEAYHYNQAMVASVAFGGSEQPGVVTRYSTLFSEFQLKLTSNENGTPWNELPLPIVPKGFYESTARDGKFLAQVVVPGDLFDLKSSYLTALDQAIEDRHYLRDARNAADEMNMAESFLAHGFANHQTTRKYISWLVWDSPAASEL